MCSDVAFTPDGRRVAAVGMQKIRIWDAATGTELDAFERGASSSSDRLAISPDGRWMAVTSPFGYGIGHLRHQPAGAVRPPWHDPRDRIPQDGKPIRARPQWGKGNSRYQRRKARRSWR